MDDSEEHNRDTVEEYIDLSEDELSDSDGETDQEEQTLMDSVYEGNREYSMKSHIVKLFGEANWEDSDSILWNFLDKADVIDQQKWKHLVSKSKFCDSCWNVLDGAVVASEINGFQMHQRCAESMTEIHHPLHPQHRLQKVDPYSDFEVKDLLCYACFFPFYGCCYFCLRCDIFLHISCTFSTIHSSSSRRSKKVSFKHFINDSHDLILYQASDIKEYLCIISRNGKYRDIYCAWCGKTVESGMSFACVICDVYLHKDCTFKVPSRIRHPSHESHTLRLKRLAVPSECSACEDSISILSYSCESCNWKIHGGCTIHLPSLTYEGHDHVLTYFEKSDYKWEVSCNTCRGRLYNPYYMTRRFSGFYRCLVCNMKFHLSCILPQTVEHKYHQHRLVLKDSTEETKGLAEYYCDICETVRNPNHCFYSCEDCDYNYVAHIECAMDQERRDVHTLLLVQGPAKLLQSFEIKQVLTSVNCSLDMRTPGDAQIQHPSHDHALTWDGAFYVCHPYRYCRCCKENLSVSDLAFVCKICRQFCLHKVCSRLPFQLLQSPLHSHHSLTLKFRNSRIRKLFVCDVCGEVNGSDCFVYQCHHCEFVVDIKCILSSQPTSQGQRFKKIELYHFSHSHKLQLGKLGSKNRLYCSFCLSQIVGLGYCCSICNFFLHEFCFRQLSLKIRVPFHPEHVFVVKVSGRKKSWCLACGFGIDGFSYSCLKCEDKHVHPICALSLGRPLKHTRHDHKLYYFGRDIHMELKKIANYVWLKCYKCDEYCVGAFYRCLKCGINFHLDCIPVPQVIKSKCHWHPVKLADSFVVKGYDLEDQYCDVCEKKRNSREHAYYCEECSSDLFVGHVECVLPKMETVIEEAKRASSVPYSNDFGANVVNTAGDQPLKLEIQDQIVIFHEGSFEGYIDIHPTKPWILECLSGSLEIWNYQELELKSFFRLEEYWSCQSARFMARDNWIVMGNNGGYIVVFDERKCSDFMNLECNESELIIHEFVAHETEICCLSVHPTRPYLLSSSKDGVIKLWDSKQKWVCVKEFLGNRPDYLYGSLQVEFNPTYHNFFASASKDDTYMIWNIDCMSPIRVYRPSLYDFKITCVNYFFTGNETYQIIGFVNGRIQLLDCKKRSDARVIYRYKTRVTQLCVHPDLSVIIACFANETIHILNATSYRLEMELKLELGDVKTIQFRKSSEDIVFVCERGIALVKLLPQ